MSIKLKSRTQSPVNGFRFEQRETGWKNWEVDQVTLWDFQALCMALRNHRIANPRFKLNTDFAAIQEEVDQANALRMTTIPGAESYIMRSGGAAEGGPTYVAPKAPSAVAAVVAAAKKLNAGHQLLSEWKESGYNPVADHEAERRAAICATCPQNQPGGFERFFTIPFSQKVKADIEDFKSRNLMTSYDEKLEVCSGCLCPLKLKVWTPMDLIQKHMTEETKAALDPRCWIINQPA